jgi:hypothetical protein
MAYYSGFGIDLPFTAASDMNGYQYRFVKIDTDTGTYTNAVNLATGASNPVPLGVLTNDPMAGGTANVRVAGVAKVWTATIAAVEVGKFLVAGSTGQAELATGSGFNAIALEDMTAGSGYISVLLRPYVSKVAGTT